MYNCKIKFSFKNFLNLQSWLYSTVVKLKFLLKKFVHLQNWLYCVNQLIGGESWHKISNIFTIVKSKFLLKFFTIYKTSYIVSINSWVGEVVTKFLIFLQLKMQFLKKNLSIDKTDYIVPTISWTDQVVTKFLIVWKLKVWKFLLKFLKST